MISCYLHLQSDLLGLFSGRRAGSQDLGGGDLDRDQELLYSGSGGARAWDPIPFCFFYIIYKFSKGDTSYAP